jgi:hypothetical protein
MSDRRLRSPECPVDACEAQVEALPRKVSCILGYYPQTTLWLILRKLPAHLTC